MTIKQDFKQLIMYTSIMIAMIIAVGTYEPMWRTICLALAGMTVVMFTYTGRHFIKVEQLAQDIVYEMQLEEKLELGEDEDE